MSRKHEVSNDGDNWIVHKDNVPVDYQPDEDVIEDYQYHRIVLYYPSHTRRAVEQQMVFRYDW